MTALLIAPVVPSTVRAVRRGRPSPLRRVAVPQLPAVRERTSTYGFAAVDDRGRIAAQVVLSSLGWVAGIRLDVSSRAGLVVVTASDAGSAVVTPQGHVRVPAAVRHRCGLSAGGRVLLVADPAEQRLVVHPPAALDTMISRQYADVFGGGGV